jgi:hypothetical protein
MGAMNFRDAYEFDPETYGGEGGGLPGMLRRFMRQQSQQQQGVDFGSTPNGAPEYSPETSFSPQGGLLGRLLSLQTEQRGYQPIPGNNVQAQSAPRDPNFRQLARVPNGTSLPKPRSPAPQPEASTPQMQAQYEPDQTQQAREAAAARLARGVRNLTRAETQRDLFNSDPVDIAKSASIGLANGAVNAAGLPGDMLTGFGYLPNNLFLNLIRLKHGLPPLPADKPDYFKSWGSDEFRHRLENRYGEFYKPNSRGGRFAETIGEMVPMVLGGEFLGVVRGAQTAGAALRELPGILVKHAVAPGVAVQALEEALPDSQAGQTLKKAYPVLRRVLPGALAAKRYLGRRIVSQ